MWNWSFAISILPKLLVGLTVTLKATFAAFALALILGFLLALMRRSKTRALSGPANLFFEFIRNTPLLIQLYFIYYVLPGFDLTFPALTCGILGLGINYSTYLAEVYRSGLEAVPKGQWEAATALNFTTYQTWRSIILPQAIPPVIPMFGNYLIQMFKDSALLSAITVVELMQTAENIGSHTFRYLEPITLVGLLFLVISYLSSIGIRVLYRSANRHLLHFDQNPTNRPLRRLFFRKGV